ncbi:unnamed protein product, partial [Prorocentrum cordatum]
IDFLRGEPSSLTMGDFLDDGSLNQLPSKMVKALMGVGQFESMRWARTQEADVQRKSICGLDEYLAAEGKRLHGPWKTGGLTEPPNIEELLRKEQTFVDNAFKARAKATAAPPRAQIAAKREVGPPETRGFRTLASFSGTLDIDSSPSPAKRQAVAASSSSAPAAPARGELEAYLSQTSGADGVGPDLGEEADAADFLGAGVRRAGKGAPRKRPAAAPTMRKPSAAPMQRPSAAPKKKASSVPYLPPAVPEGGRLVSTSHKSKLFSVEMPSFAEAAVMSDAHVGRALREAGCIPPKTDRACWRCGNDMVEQENCDFRCWVKSCRCTMSAWAFTPLLNTSPTTADYYSCIWATGCGLDQAQTHRVTGASRKKVELLMPRIAEAAAWKSMQAADNFEHSTGEVEMGAFACSVRRAGSATQNVHVGRGIMVVDCATGTRVVFPAKGAAVQEGAPPPPVGAEDVAPAMAKIDRDAKQFAKTEKIGIKSSGAALTKMAAKRHAQMRKNGRNSTAAMCAKGPMKSKKGPMKTAKSSEAGKRTKGPMKSAKSTRGSNTSYLLTRSSTNMAEANIGVAKGSLHRRSYLGKRNESMRTQSQLFYENTPGLTPILNAMGEFTKFFLDSCDPWQLLGKGNWQVIHKQHWRGVSACEGPKTATEGWFCRPLPAPKATAVLPEGELEPFLALTNDVGENENPLVHYIDFITGYAGPIPPELDEEYKAAWKDNDYHQLPPPFGFKSAPPSHAATQMCIFGGPNGTNNTIKHCILPNKAKAVTFASMAFGGAKKLVP